jgi:hypothetical protein
VFLYVFDATSSASATFTSNIERVQFGGSNIVLTSVFAANAIEKWEPEAGTAEIWTPVDPATEIWQYAPNASGGWTASP